MDFVRDYKSRKLAKVTSKKRPSRLLFFDTETYRIDAKLAEDGTVVRTGWDEYLLHGAGTTPAMLHRMKLAWVCYSRYTRRTGLRDKAWKKYKSAKALCLYLESLTYNKSPLHIFGHNIFFDLQVSDFFYWFTRWGWQLEFIYDKGVTYILVISKDSRRIKAVSTTNYFPQSLDKLGAMLGKPKGKVDFEKSSDAKLSRYCRRDVEIVRDIIEYYLKFIDDNDLGRFALTKSSTAWSAFRRKFMRTPIYLHKEDDVRDMEQRAYMGARCEIHSFGVQEGGPFVSLDVNGLYPHVMATNLYPCRLVDTAGSFDLDKLPATLNRYAMVAEVDLETDQPVYAVYFKGRLVFPVGKFTTWLCTGGLKYALSHGHIRGVYDNAVYEKGDLFSDYCRFVTGLKEHYTNTGSKIERKFAKDLGNCLYGKFGQKRDIEESRRRVDADAYWRDESFDLDTGEPVIINQLFNIEQILYGREFANDSFTAIAAHVTEYARLLLWSYIQRVGYYNVLYCDTDSLKIRTRDKELIAESIDPVKTGKLKVEDEFREFVIYGNKYYFTEHDRKIKGVPHKSQYLGDFRYKYTQFSKQATHLRGRIYRSFLTHDVVKQVTPRYTKGRTLKDGRVVPLEFNSLT